MERTMKRTLTLMLSLALLASVHAAGPDDQYLEIYSIIQQADGLRDPGVAASRYLQAQAGLKKIQSVYPNWQADIVKFRLDYVSEKLAALQPTLAQTASQVAPAAKTPAATNSVRSPAVEQEIADLNEQIRNLSSEKNALERKLKEALSVQKSMIDPSEMAKAEETITMLKKERDQLSVTLEQQKTNSPAIDETILKQQKEQTALLAEQSKSIKALTVERDTLTNQVAALTKTIGELQVQASQAQVDFQKKLAESARSNTVVAAVVPAPKVETKVAQAAPSAPHRAWYNFWSSGNKSSEQTNAQASSKEIAQLRARIAVLEAKPLRHTSEELAMIKQANSKPIAESALPAPAVADAAPVTAMSATTTNASKSTNVVHSIKDLPAGSGALMAEAQRAYNTGDYKTAEQKFAEVLRQDEKNVYVLSRLASAQLSAGHTEACEKSVQQALAADPNDAASLFLLGNLRIRQDKLDEALDALSRSAAINPNNAATQNSLGGALNQKGLLVPAEAALRKALQLDPNYPEAHHNLALVYASQKPPFLELARWHYKKALALGQPQNPEFEKILNSK